MLFVGLLFNVSGKDNKPKEPLQRFFIQKTNFFIYTDE